MIDPVTLAVAMSLFLGKRVIAVEKPEQEETVAILPQLTPVPSPLYVKRRRKKKARKAHNYK